VVRPLLDVPRAALREHLAQRAIAWREDGSNTDQTFPRARVRHGVLPAIVAAFPHAPAHLAAFAADLAADEALLSGLLAENGVWPEVGRPVPSALVAALPAPLMRRWVLELAGRLPLAEPPSRRQLDGVSDMLSSGQPAAVDLGRRWVLRLRGDTLLLQPPPVPQFAPCPAAVPSRVEMPGGFVGFLGDSSVATARHRAKLHSRLRECAVSWRSLVPGERFGGVTAVRRLAARGVPAQWRRAWPVLQAGDTIVWLPAVGVAECWGEDGAEAVAVGLEEPWKRHDS
jgi:hypothetical protein